jgi:hypothetical protein
MFAPPLIFELKKPPNAALQLRRAISIQAIGNRLLENHAIAPSVCKRLLAGAFPEAALCSMTRPLPKADRHVDNFLGFAQMENDIS